VGEKQQTIHEHDMHHWKHLQQLIMGILRIYKQLLFKILPCVAGIRSHSLVERSEWEFCDMDPLSGAILANQRGSYPRF
jgi:hypothetical protein